jgi:hypothetical protein
MKGVLCVSALLLAVGLAAGGKEKKPIKGDKLKVNVDYLEKSWGLKYKSHTAGIHRETGGRVTILVEFTKDVEDVKGLREEVSSPTRASPTRATAKVGARSPLWFYLFDADNVLVQKAPLTSIEGELSDRVRLVVDNIPSDKFEKGEKLEARPAESKKRKRKKADEE